MHKKLYLNNKGFTLVELAIVIVIIGLLVGGVLQGQELIKQSKINATVSQFQQFNAAVNTFKAKYNFLPADIPTSLAQRVGLLWATPAYTLIGNANGVINDTHGIYNKPEGEVIMFWRHLADAKLIKGSYAAHHVNNTAAYPNQGLTDCCTGSQFFPVATLKDSLFWTAGSSSGVNYLILAPTQYLQGNGSGYQYNSRGASSPAQAYGIDVKLDDGLPNTGIIQARVNISGLGNDTNDYVFTPLSSTTASPYAVTPVAGTCQTGGASSTDEANTYAFNGSSSENAPACILRLRTDY